jgi:hypothetical protein
LPASKSSISSFSIGICRTSQASGPCRLRDDERLRRIPVVFMCNAAGRRNGGHGAGTVGRAGHLSKPFYPDDG